MSKPRVKMPISERAKQFAPFSPLTGLGRALAAKERLRVLEEKRIVSEDMAAENDRVLQQIQPGIMVNAIYYHGGEYIFKRGVVSKFSPEEHSLTIVDTEISFENLFEITLDK